LFAQSSGGDFAGTGMSVGGIDGTYASVKNYGMYGYVADNFAYAGQYADQIKGEFIDMHSITSNYVDTSSLPVEANEKTQTGLPADFLTYIAPVYSTAAEHSLAYASINGITQEPPTDASNIGITQYATPAAASPYITASEVYQFAQAGGSKDPTAYPMGIWAQAVNDKKHKLTLIGAFSGAVGDTSSRNDGVINGIEEYTYGEYDASSNRNNDAGAIIRQTATTTTPSASITPNAVSMGYADKNIVYANEDTSLSSNDNVPFYDTTSFTGMNSGTSKTTETTRNQRPIDSGDGNELFVYSIVNTANPNGLSDALFF